MLCAVLRCACPSAHWGTFAVVTVFDKFHKNLLWTFVHKSLYRGLCGWCTVDLSWILTVWAQIGLPARAEESSCPIPPPFGSQLCAATVIYRWHVRVCSPFCRMATAHPTTVYVTSTHSASTQHPCGRLALLECCHLGVVEDKKWCLWFVCL